MQLLQPLTLREPVLQPLARIVVPAGLEVRRIQGDDLWGIRHDSLDVPSIVKYTITR